MGNREDLHLETAALIGAKSLALIHKREFIQDQIMLSRIIRRTHMYLALFLTPWMVMYALSTVAMNHREFFQRHYGETTAQYEKEKEKSYSGTFPNDATPRMMAEQVLSDLQMEGAYGVNRPRPGEPLIIYRHEPIIPRRITYMSESGVLVIERQVFRTPSFLERLHRRRGYVHKYLLEDAWALSVDLVILAIVFWVLSGLWMWWELRLTHFWGLICMTTGLGLFGFFLLMI